MLSSWLSFTKLFGGNGANGKRENSVLYAPGTQIAFDTKLVTRLKRDHQELVRIYLMVTRQVQDRQFQKIKPTMESFVHEFNAHVLMEYTKLYVFLDYSFKNDDSTHDLIVQFRKEMNLIGKAVRNFYGKWKETNLGLDNIEPFTAELQAIGEVLVKRIKTEEENLYEIYQSAPGLLMINGHKTGAVDANLEAPLFEFGRQNNPQSLKSLRKPRYSS